MHHSSSIAITLLLLMINDAFFQQTVQQLEVIQGEVLSEVSKLNELVVNKN